LEKPTSFKTKREREGIQVLYDGIDLNALPMSFRDVITVIKELGMRYLWIDTICIIQDDHSGWIDQAPLMGTIIKFTRRILSDSGIPVL
jgi:hypothetical protein